MGASSTALRAAQAANPFDLDDDASYRRWRDWKLAHRAASVDELVVDVRDPRALSRAERLALLERMGRANMALYRSPIVDDDRNLPRTLGAQLGLHELDANWLADEDGVSSIAVSRDAPPTALPADPPEGDRPARVGPAPGGSAGRGGFIPYTDRPLRWHTDGYYHPAKRRIRGMILHCVRPARSGGENALLDHEMAYIALRDASPQHVRALMQPDAMTIPARTAPKLTSFAALQAAPAEGRDDDGVARAAQTGPVFSVDAQDGSLHMRYTARTRSIEWKADAATRAAVAALEALLAGGAPWILRTTMQAGMGLVSHNVLHDRSAFVDDPARPRLIYRARFLDRVVLASGAPWRNG